MQEGSKRNRTLAIIKPDVVEKRRVGEIITMIEKEFHITEMKMVRMTKDQAIEFYKEHEGKEFFNSLTEFMSSGPMVAMVVEGENVVQRFREFVGETDPRKAREGTIRKIFGEGLPRNAIHASDSEKSAEREIEFFFGNSR
ncbi:MAG: nucleoside-diphosphate kinase [Brevinematia bacterium]